MTWIRINDVLFDLEKVDSIAIHDSGTDLLISFTAEESLNRLKLNSKEEAREVFERVSKQLVGARQKKTKTELMKEWSAFYKSVSNDQEPVTAREVAVEQAESWCSTPEAMERPAILNHTKLVDKLNRGLLSAVEATEIDKTLSPVYRDDGYYCICPTCTPSLL